MFYLTVIDIFEAIGGLFYVQRVNMYYIVNFKVNFLQCGKLGVSHFF